MSIFRSPAGYFCELTSPDEFEAIEVELDTEMLEKAGWTAPAPGGRWARNFLSVSDAAEGVIEAMYRGMGCDCPDYYQSDDPTGNLSVNAPTPVRGLFPWCLSPVAVLHQSRTRREESTQLPAPSARMGCL